MTFSGLTWDHPRGYNALAAAAERAAAEGAPVIEWAKQPLEGFESHPIADLAARFDVLVLDHPHIGEAVAADCLRPLEDLFEAAEIRAWMAQTIGPAMESYVWQGKHYALPLDVATQVMAYRADLCAAPPTTWDDVDRLAGTRPVAVSISGPHAICSFVSLCVSLGAEPGGEALIDDATANEAIARLTALARRAPAGTDTMNPIALLAAMSRGDGIALVPLVYGYVNYAVASPGRHAVAFADAPVAAPGGRHGSVLGGTGIAVTRKAKADARLLDHLRWLMRRDTQSTFIPDHDGQPSARAAWLSDAVNAAAGGFYRATLSTTEEAWVRPRHAGYIAFQLEGSAILREAFAGRAAPQSTIDTLRAAWSRSLAKETERRP